MLKATNMDEGDVARLLRRVADYLTQARRFRRFRRFTARAHARQLSPPRAL